MEDAKIYNVCLMRVSHQIVKAKQRRKDGLFFGSLITLESYNTGDMDDIIDILEIYDLEDRSPKGLSEKLDDLSYTVSVLVREKIFFDYDEKGNLGLCLELKGECPTQKINDPVAALAAA